MKTISWSPVTLIITLVLLLSACSPSNPPVEPTLTPIPPTPSTPKELLEPFSYDASLPLEVEWGKMNDTDGVEVHTISYASLMGDRVPAYYVKPAGEGPYPAVIFLHCGHKASCTKTEFTYEAIQLAKIGIASLSIDGPLLRMPEANFDPGLMFINSVLDIRRAVDLLGSLPEIDGGKIAYVGHSYGATTGGILAGVETRLIGFVLMAGHAEISKLDGPKEIQYLDAVNYIGHGDQAALFFQFAEQDLFISHDAANFFYKAASQNKEIQWYDSDHDFNTEARNDRAEWLVALFE